MTLLDTAPLWARFLVVAAAALNLAAMIHTYSENPRREGLRFTYEAFSVCAAAWVAWWTFVCPEAFKLIDDIAFFLPSRQSAWTMDGYLVWHKVQLDQRPAYYWEQGEDGIWRKLPTP